MARKLARKVSNRRGGRIVGRPRASAGTHKGVVAPAVLELAVVVSVQPISRPQLAPGRLSLWRGGRALRVASALSLLVALALALGASWRDGIPGDDYGLTGSVPPATAPTFVSGRGGDPDQQAMAVGSFLRPSGPTARPVEILIPALDVHRAVEKVGIDQSGVLNLPVNAWNAGWFEYGPVPGAPGDAVIEGHSGYPGKPLIFGSLYMLRPGDQVIVVLADRSRRLFIVVSMTTVPQGPAPPGLADPYGPPRLTLITCTGHFDKNVYSYTSRLVLEARYAGLA